MLGRIVSDLSLRQRIMELLEARASRNGGYVTRAELSEFDVDGAKLRLVDTTRGIWNPSWMEATLSILSSPSGPYVDEFVGNGMIRYEYQSGSDEGINAKLRRAYELAVPVVMLRKVDDGVFVPILPVYVVADDRQNRRFLISVDDRLRAQIPDTEYVGDFRAYAQRVLYQRLHQPEFRAKVIRAYEARCAICSLRHASLLDAAHIIRDSHEDGLAIVSNGLSLCKIHHSAYDENIIGIRPDYTVSVRPDVLLEEDGPMLKHGIQEMHGRRLILPTHLRDRPDPDRLEVRFADFLKSA